MTKNKSETRYLYHKESIKLFLAKYHWSDIMRCMVENLDNIDDLNTSQSVEMFKLVSLLEDAINSYERVHRNVNDKTAKI
jgi:hypothetical protein